MNKIKKQNDTKNTTYNLESLEKYLHITKNQ